jgi:alkyl sulfatase BDS1-like metallo-beta-lactamase superfamily hydrolase
MAGLLAGLPIAGAARMRRVLLEVASTPEKLVAGVLALMNQGATLDDVIHTVRVEPELLEKPYLKPLYDEPEFVVRNVWRLYGGWYDGNPARLEPAPDAQLAGELAALAGGAGELAAARSSSRKRAKPASRAT